MSPRVVYWNNIPAPYMVDRFNAIAARDRLDFEAWFSARTEGDRSWSVDEATWRFCFRYLPKITVRARPLAFPSRLFDSTVPDVLVGLHADPGFLFFHPLARARGVRTVLWVTPTFDAWIRRRRSKEAIKRRVFPRVDAVFTTGSDGRRFVERYGAASERVFVLRHFVDCSYLAPRPTIDSDVRKSARAEFGIRGIAFLYVGRLWSGKGLEYLLDAFAMYVSRRGSEATLVLVGDGPEEARLRRRSVDENLNVVFAGFHQRDELSRIYAAADIFVFPTLGDPFGHVVEEAMSCGLPVISTSAAGEIHDRINDGDDGFIVPPADSRALLERMELLAANDSLRAGLGHAAAERVAGHTADGWACQFESAVEAVLALDRTRRRATGSPGRAM
jgi:glycosyltransferase involved in cell wall biosynthesis